MIYILKIANWKPLSFFNQHLLIACCITTFIAFLLLNNKAHANTNAVIKLPESQLILSVKEDKALVSNNTTNNNWLFLHPYTAHYQVSYNGSPVGKATRKLTIADKQWQLETKAKIKKYLLTAKSYETTQFHIKDNQLMSDYFVTRSKVTFQSEKVVKQFFDWEKKTDSGFKGKKKWHIPLDNQVYDRASHIVKFRSDLLSNKTAFNYDVSYRGKIKTYQYTQEKEEKFKTKMGELNTIKYIYKKSEKGKFILWLCPELNYIPVKIAQYEKDGSVISFLLESLEYN